MEVEAEEGGEEEEREGDGEEMRWERPKYHEERD
jgi:hypothetical protein